MLFSHCVFFVQIMLKKNWDKIFIWLWNKFLQSVFAVQETLVYRLKYSMPVANASLNFKCGKMQLSLYGGI